MSQLRHSAGTGGALSGVKDTHHTDGLHSPQDIDDVLVVVQLLQRQVVVVGDPDLAQRLLELAHLMGGGDVQHSSLAVVLQPLAVGEQDVALLDDVSLGLGAALVQD